MLPSRCLVLALLLCVIPALTPAHGQEEGRKCSVNQAKKLLGDLTYGDEKRAAKARTRLLETRAKDRKNILKAFDRGFFRGPKKLEGRGSYVSFKVEGGNEGCPAGTYLVRVPKAYSGKKPFPLLMRFHGSGDTAANYSGIEASGRALLDRMIVVVPENPTEDRMSWASDGAKRFVDTVFREVQARYNVDPDRIYLSGFSAGGGAAAFLTQDWPHRVAAFWSSARVYVKFHPEHNASCDSAARIPGLFMVGLDDREDRVEGYRKVEAYYAKKKYPGTFEFIEGRGHVFFRDREKKAFEFLLAQSRPADPKVFQGLFYRYSNTPIDEKITWRQHWIELDSLRSNDSVFRVEVKDNVIKLVGSPMKGRFLLSDELIDFDQPVTLVLNGKKQDPVRVERSLPFLLDRWMRERDAKRHYWNELPFELN